MDKRKEELMKVFESVDKNKKAIIAPLIDEVIFLEAQLTELKKYPFVKVHPTDPQLQKPTTAGKMYKEFFQQYNNAIKTLCSVLHKQEGNDTSPLREYLQRFE